MDFKISYQTFRTIQWVFFWVMLILWCRKHPVLILPAVVYEIPQLKGIRPIKYDYHIWLSIFQIHWSLLVKDPVNDFCIWMLIKKEDSRLYNLLAIKGDQVDIYSKSSMLTLSQLSLFRNFLSAGSSLQRCSTKYHPLNVSHLDICCQRPGYFHRAICL